MSLFTRKVVAPVIIAVGSFLLVIMMLSGFGELLLQLYVPGDTPDRLDRPELWTALGAAAVVIFGLGFWASRSGGDDGVLDRDVVIGKRSFFPRRAGESEEEHEGQQDMAALRAGERGTIGDIAEGYTLYAANGPLGVVDGVLGGGVDHGKTFSGFLYARGLRGASREMWVPFEAVTAVYPESKTAILSIRGDETEHFGWNTPPESIRRGPPRHDTSVD